MSAPDRQSNRQIILNAAEELMAQKGFYGVSMREIAREAGVNLGSVTYHFKTKENLLAEIYSQHTRPMNLRREELLNEANRISDANERLIGIIRAYVIPAFSSNTDSIGGGSRFTRLRALLSMEGNDIAAKIIARAFDDTTRKFISSIRSCLPGLSEEQVVWRSHFLLGSLYYTLVNSDRINRLTEGRCDGGDHTVAINELVNTTVHSLKCENHSSMPLNQEAASNG